ncbi:NAD(P)-dependent dehydrogenase, short-chain alcohol dehydrogenase family [Desulfocicer vacuolatum DSM 3385]|uniref:NAD(P)-dependent dehydrogenase, short-chain alcohol dehydrogenase family n=1 Tax=Desulfocicer vacuolatum DSM 3385 TaxID=1121400 RepID=A0A1W2EDQ5_9BACT|nr:3-hydroxyacyl-CoA dehydrogenase [Desulfocicer vacuolatum]SMD07787.1 NAD(P)-dependent dehydrogenase, short-chain alcohol dehydrogenase family [Desulfocicer vacuolatum DSM 3385]
MDIKGCTAVVTGGASGLGEACVRDLSAKGAKVAIFDFDETMGQKAIGESGDSVIFCKTDVSDENSVKMAIEKTIQAFGNIHFAINCAGIGTPGKVLSRKGPMPLELFNKVLQVNLVGTMNVLRLTAEKMMDNAPNEDGEKGVIINTASIAAFEGQIGQAAYSASKGGIVGMTLPIAREFASYGIRVMTIAPGLFETPMLAGLPQEAKKSIIANIPFPKRLARPSEFALMVKHIIENPILNGETIRLDSCIRLAIK